MPYHRAIPSVALNSVHRKKVGDQIAPPLIFIWFFSPLFMIKWSIIDTLKLVMHLASIKYIFVISVGLYPHIKPQIRAQYNVVLSITTLLSSDGSSSFSPQHGLTQGISNFLGTCISFSKSVALNQLKSYQAQLNKEQYRRPVNAWKLVFTKGKYNRLQYRHPLQALNIGQSRYIQI